MSDTAPTSTSEGGNGVAEQAQDKAKEVASQAQEKAREATGQARGRLREQVDQRSTQLGDQVGSTASDARSVSEELRKQGKDAPARYLDQAAGRAERLGGYLRDSDSDRILNDVEDFARRNTWAVALGGLALGFAASRLLKASSSNRYQHSLQGNGGGELTGHPPAAATSGRSMSESPASEGGRSPTFDEPGIGGTPVPAPASGSTGDAPAAGASRPGSGQ